MKRLVLALSAGLSLLAAPASADVWDSPEPSCNQLWFTRNLIMHRAGYCFASPLGQALFGNAGCRGTEVKLSARESRQVAKMQAMERELGCKVNTRARQLDVPADTRALRQLRDLPLSDGGVSGCRWAANPVPLLDGYTPGSRQIGEIRAGDTLVFSDQPEGNWTAVTIRKGGYDGPVAMGWFDHSRHDVEKGCTDWAG
ncbi:DUF4453 domain-containing protein [Paracoccus sp. (in: a-proteobacteria)]|uniref:DUF4453 domain-containing protein n=1 Tax=Paracoccus sp. TaxID=267 RepID=UPI00321FB036